ncbi:protocadherin-11 x-linked [Plakobranchus ocellatus]|uniref:Protocadherin-11 x-linked n=1 Tax=Plakobranchus ocellatus TaxID=259542 RepID=A0AAV3YG75_9GAST|nr:protocadherin-11 x-linked [Plakobranchus ocellatus]
MALSMIDVFTCTALTSLILHLALGQDVMNIEYTAEEERGAGYFIGNTSEESGLAREFAGNFQLLVFNPFTRGNPNVEYLAINSTNGVIRTAKNVDREAICKKRLDCSITLDIGVHRRSPASDTTELIRLLKVTINILDINDQPPTFQQNVVTLQVSENLPVNHQLYTSVATDADADGPNSIISYRLEPNTPDFIVTTERTTSGLQDLVITVKKVLNREEQASYPLVVVASDNGKPARSSSVLINVQVTDVNDNTPVFGKPNYTANVLENSDYSSPVVIVSASDRDAGENARVTYSLSSQASQKIKDTFTVDADTGEVFSRRFLDYETEDSHQFYVTASDHGSPPKSAFALVTVKVLDVNDNKPIILVTSAPGGDVVTEHSSVGKFLAHIRVSDRDSGVNGQVACSILDPHFSLEPIDESSPGYFKIILRQELDREEAAKWNVDIQCVDGDPQPKVATATLTITVRDINDNPPSFLPESLQGSVMEEKRGGTFVMKVEATDPDAGENARVSYSLGFTQSEELFSIDPDTGVITTGDTLLDRETRDEYFLVVIATDHGPVGQILSATATATVRILDENDNPPRFSQQGFSRSITENLPKGSPAGDVSATDLDIDQNARFIFSILPPSTEAAANGNDDGQFFTIDSQTGLLRSMQPFDREKKDMYKFSVKVADPAVSNYFDVANVTVTIDDDNDHTPVLVEPPVSEREFTCLFNQTVGELIAVFRAEDGDDPKLTELSYSVRWKSGSATSSVQARRRSEASSSLLFSMDRLSGKLRVAREIRPEDIGAHTLEVVVQDGTSASAKTAVVAVVVTVAEGSEEEMSRFASSSDEDNNVTIVVVILVCTALLAIIIIAVICLIRRVDRKRRGLAASTHPAPSSPSHQAQMDAKLYQAAQWVSTVTPADPRENGVKSRLEVHGADKTNTSKKKKEVSFSLDDMVVESPDTSGSMNSVFSPRGKHDGLTFKQPQEQNFIVMDGMTTPDYSQHLYDSRSSSTDNPDERQFMEVGSGGGGGGGSGGGGGRAAEDRYSDASSGDTGTSDSGRGGSEDEGHGHNSSGERVRILSTVGSDRRRPYLVLSRCLITHIDHLSIS